MQEKGKGGDRAATHHAQSGCGNNSPRENQSFAGNWFKQRVLAQNRRVMGRCWSRKMSLTFECDNHAWENLV